MTIDRSELVIVSPTKQKKQLRVSVGNPHPDTCDANHNLPARVPAILNPVSPPEIARLRRFAKCKQRLRFLDLHS